MEKKLTFILLFISTIALATPNDVLKQADSLFSQQRYVQAFEKYEQLLYENNVASPAMLLRMAYIKEGLKQVDEALYFLNMYYLSTMDKKALQKMEELAETNNLSGFDAGDLEYFLSYYYSYYQEIIWLLVALTFLCFSLLVYRKRQGVQRPVLGGVFFIIFIGLLYYQVNYGKTYNKGIIIIEDVYVMSGPSAGAKVIDIVSAGHRVNVLGQEDVWTKIRWEEEAAYVKNKNIREILFL